MRIVGPRNRFDLMRRITGDVTADGEETYWRKEADVYGVVTTIKSVKYTEGVIHGKVGVQSGYRLFTNRVDITEEDRLRKDSVEYNITFVDPKFLKNKIMAVDLIERKG